MGTGDGVTFFSLDPSSAEPVLTGRIDFASGGYVQQKVALDGAGNVYIDAEDESPGTATPLQGRVDVFRAGSSGAATPVRTLSGEKTQLVSVRSIAVDASGYLYVAVANADVGSVLAFAPSANGNVAPIWSFKRAQNDGIWFPSGLALDKSGDVLVGDSEDSPVAVFAPQASGPTTPIRTYGPTLGDPTGVAVDPNGRVYVSEWQSSSVDLFDASPSGPPLPALAGPQTGISSPLDVAVDAEGRIAVANQTGTVSIFAAGATGDVAPLHRIAGGISVAFSP